MEQRILWFLKSVYFRKVIGINFPNKNNQFQIPTNDILCSATESEERRKSTLEMICVLHFNEIAFLQMLKKDGKNLQMKVPQLYYCREISETRPGFILMEDLSENVSKTPFTGLKFLNDDQVSYYYKNSNIHISWIIFF